MIKKGLPKRYVWNFVTPFTIASVSRSMFEYADCVGVSVFDTNATGLLSCRRHPTLSVRHQPQVPFPSVGGSTTDMIRCRYISSERHMYTGDLRATRMERPS